MKVKANIKSEDALDLEALEDTLSSRGYQMIARDITEAVEQANKKLQDPEASVDELRQAQGEARGLLKVLRLPREHRRRLAQEVSKRG